MKLSNARLCERFKKYYSEYPAIGLAVGLSRMNFADDYFALMEPRMQKAYEAMRSLEKGGGANPDENRMVGHYWFRNPVLAPSAGIREQIEGTLKKIREFAAQIHAGTIQGAEGAFKNVLVIGIGGSALGPQFVADALGQPLKDKLKVYFFNNTDPDGMDKVFAQLRGELGQTLCIVISKSGGTKETRNGMLEARAAYEKAGLQLAEHAVCVTGAGSALDRFAAENRWITSFPMWDRVGGRTSELSAVGLLPAALQGIDADEMIRGARRCDEITRNPDTRANPAAQLALMLFHAGNGKSDKDMVVLPYKVRLELFSKYLQQFVMESLGKESDWDGNLVNQGITVYWNKGSTDQHAYVQHLIYLTSNFLRLISRF